MIQTSAKYLNLGINLKTPSCNIFNKTIPNEYFSTGPFPIAFSNFTQENFLLSDGKITSPTDKKYKNFDFS